MDQASTQTIATFTGTLLRRERALEQRFVQLVFREEDKDWLCVSSDPRTATLPVGQNYRIEGIFKQRGERAFVYDPKIAVIKKHWRPIRRVAFAVALVACVSALGGVAYMHEHSSTGAPTNQATNVAPVAAVAPTSTQASNTSQSSSPTTTTPTAPTTTATTSTPPAKVISAPITVKHTTQAPAASTPQPVSTPSIAPASQGSSTQPASSTTPSDGTGAVTQGAPVPPVDTASMSATPDTGTTTPDPTPAATDSGTPTTS